MSKQKFIKNEKIRFQHCDQAGIVFYPRYFVMLNDLVEDWFDEEIGFSFKDMHPDFGVPTVNIQADFRKSATIGDILTKSLYVTEIGNKSVTYRYEFWNQNNEIVLEGTGTLVSISKTDSGGMKGLPWRDDVRTNMEKFFHA